ncbi:PR-1-like protein [Acephala macrosclerotiorum]|nr:PR-1-like protein [Acephala macrosclerotiorum]
MSTSLDKDAEKALHLHNQARAEIHEDPRPPLTWSHTLASDATSYARKLAARNLGLKHSSPNERVRNGEVCGENLAMQSWGDFGMGTASRLWVEEKYKYKGERVGVTGRDSLWGHYTEIIWPKVTKAGIGMAKSSSGAAYVVARYDKCQITGALPYDKRKGDLFKNRQWKPVGVSSSRRNGSQSASGSSKRNNPRHEPNQRQGHNPDGSSDSNPWSAFQIQRQGGSSGAQTVDLIAALRQLLGPRYIIQQGQGPIGIPNSQMNDPLAGLMQALSPFIQGHVQVQGLQRPSSNGTPRVVRIDFRPEQDPNEEVNKALRNLMNQGRRR